MNDEKKNKNKQADAEKYSMNFGITGISKLSSRNQRSHLPSSTSVDPCEGKIEEKLKKILEIKTLNQAMVQLLQPGITDRSILTPQKFRLKIQQVCDIFSETLEQEGLNFHGTELFTDVIKLLKDEEEKCELLEQYRHMLLMG
ncbi:MAG: hypothetical protein LBI56_02890 [Puniceicoccales bacterium]|jgi:hypothetical protein|nr:hypothetical protein [Puniceicoccales bacterium]